MKEIKERLDAIKELAREHSKWLIWYTNVHIFKHEELILIIIAAKAYKEKLEKKKRGIDIVPLSCILAMYL